MSRITLRALRGREEYEQAQNIARAAWKFSDLALTAVSDLQMVDHVGGLTAAAFDGGKMLGFVHGVPRTNLREPCMHSHLLAVLPEARGQGLAHRLKFFQRQWCLKRGIKLVTWTYDPLLLKNAHLNLVRLKAQGRVYLQDFYGPMGGIYGGLPTDRFEIHWRLTDPAVRKAARARPADAGDAETLPLFTGGRPRGRRLTVDIPLNAPDLYASDTVAALRERLRFRRLAGKLLASGYAAVAIKPLLTRALYVFEKG